MQKTKENSAKTSTGAEVETTIETTERENLRKLARALPEDFDLEKTTRQLSEARMLQKRYARKSRAHLYVGLRLAYMIALAATKLANIKQAVFAVCSKQKITFKGSTSLVQRIVRGYMTDDPARASDYAMAIRGAIVAGFSPDEMLEKLKAKEETLGSLADRLREKTVTRPSETVRAVLSPSAYKRFFGLAQRKKLLAIVVADPAKRQIKIRLLTARKERVLKKFAQSKSPAPKSKIPKNQKSETSKSKTLW